MIRKVVFLFVCTMLPARLAVSPALSAAAATPSSPQPNPVMSAPLTGGATLDAAIDKQSGRLIAVTDDLKSAYIYLTEDQSGNMVLYGGAKRPGSLRDSAVSFELNQSSAAGHRTQGDLRISLSFDHDGGLNRVETSRWDDAARHPGFVSLAGRVGAGCVDDGSVCAFTRTEASVKTAHITNNDAADSANGAAAPSIAEFGVRIGSPESFSTVQVDTLGDHLTLPAGSSQAADTRLALNCVNDLEGPDDAPGQKDLNKLCLGIPSDYPGTCNGDFTISWNWDAVDQPGANTLDACALFDTNGNGNVNYALCVEADGFLGDFLYSCSDQKIDRCTNPVLISTKASHCTSSTMATDPWPCPHGGDACPNDQVATCCVELSDFGSTGAVFVDTCSYPSDNPNSDASDCIFLGASCTTVCPGGNCAGGPCDDHVGCTVDSCQVIGTETTCVHTPDNSQCDDGNSCTDDTCSPALGSFACVFTPAPGRACGDPSSAACDAPDSCDAEGICESNRASSTTICRASTGPCDVAERCDGVSPSCPPDGFQPSTTPCTGTSNGGACDGVDSCDGAGHCLDGYQPATTTCRPSTGPCDAAESCTGRSGACPADAFAPSTTTCTGTSNGGPCDGNDSCDGAGHCVDGFLTATTVCRPAAGDCDAAESCTGSSGACPADVYAPSTTTCTGNSHGGACDGNDSCDGDGHCVDGFKPATTICRAATGDCDVAESCTGNSGDCPADTFKPSTTSCTGSSNGGPCDGTDSCDGAGHCIDGYQPATTICRDAAGECDVTESCTGKSGSCPADSFKPSTTSCTGSSHGGPCDATDSCDGAGHCVDGYQPATTICRAAVSECDAAESCTGTSGDCPADGYKPSTTTCTGASNGGACDGTDSCDGAGHCIDGYRSASTVCRPAVGECDVAETCTGKTSTCPPDVFKPSTTTCTGTSNGGACDGADSCDGAGHCVDGYQSPAMVCRPSTGTCDPAESCTGTSGACPADAFAPSTTTCTGTSNGGPCDGADSCDGAGHCVDGYQPTTMVCRPATGVCDVAESCTGKSGACPADTFAPSTTTCTGTSNGGPCDGTDSCDGAGHCVDGYQPRTLVCRPTTGPCDPAESCTGTSGACPADAFAPSTTACTGTSNSGACDGTDSCDGAGHCVDGFLTATTICRPAVGGCDVAESCTGKSGACPADGFKPSTTSCTGTSNGGPCDGTDSCDGAGHCVDGYQSATTVCRPAVGPCDIAESCTGSSGACPANIFASTVTPCTGTSNGGACDATSDACDGAGHCVDIFLPGTTVCRPATGPCDLAESCTGASGACPANAYAPSTTTCVGTSSGGACDGTDSCDGAGHCVDGYKPATTVCRPAASDCDVAESCTGTSGACPANAFKPSTTICASGASNTGICDGTDSCDGAGHCIDGYKPSTVVCRQAVGSCDVTEYCTGTTSACPANGFKPATTSCTGTSNGGACDGSDSCDGSGHCIDGYKPATTVCRASAGSCDLAESCTGTSGACPADRYQPSTMVCRPSTGVCDPAESCTGTSATCPANGFLPVNAPCTGISNGGACDGSDSCDGAGHCVDGYQPATTICRSSTGSCDPAESCTGSSGACPADAHNTGVCQPIGECTPPYPFVDPSNSLTSLAFVESEVLRGFTATVGDGCLPNQIRVYYSDEHALTLGIRRVIVKDASGSHPHDFLIAPPPSVPSHALDPAVGTQALTGDQAGVDVSGRPIFPSLFVTDTTTDPDSLGGDWQYGGTPIPPHAVFGTWKGAVRTVDYTHVPTLITVTPDQDPTQNHWDLGGGDPPPPGLLDVGYGAEARWDTSRLGLIAGHTYRFYFMVHDGDQNKAGGDSGQGCVNVQTAPVCPGPCQSNADCDDRDICTTDTCNHGVCTNEIAPGSQCLCAPSDCPSVDPGASITSSVAGNGDVTVTVTESTDINDNSYGANSVGWPSTHNFNDLVGSDKANFIFKDANGNVVMNFFLDYISQTTVTTATPSGFASLGTGGDGGITVGSSSWLMSWQTSLAANLNSTGYCVNGNCTVAGVNLLQISPPTSPRTSYNVAAAFSQWKFPISYTVKISHSAFGAAGFGSVSVPSLRNSPPKCGDNLTNIGACPCDGTIGNFVWDDLNGNGIQGAGEPGIGGVALTLTGGGQNLTTTTDANGMYEFTGVCPGSYTVTVTPATVPSWLVPTQCQAGSDDTRDNNCSPATVTLTQNHPSTASIDFGYRGKTCANPADCSDGNVCNGAELCVANVCQPGTAPSCDDGISCTLDSCNPATGCVHTSSIGAASISSDFNGTAIPAGGTVWFNANLNAKGIAAGVTTVRWTNSAITLKVGTQITTQAVPDGQVVFDSAATCATTSFNTAVNRWETRVPVGGSDEIFLSGLALPVPAGFPGGIKPVAWTGQFTVDKPGVEVQWKWGAAAYAGTSMSDYNSLGVKPTHNNACSYANSDHAGAPENSKSFVIGGARGGGGANATGSWSGTQTSKLTCVVSQAADSGPVAGLSFLDKQQISWSVAQDAMSYDIIRGDVADLRAGGGVGAAYCADDDVDTTQSVESLDPQPGQCFFYVVRGDAVSPSAGTYDTLQLPPVGNEGRDQKVGTIGVDCTHRQQ